MIRNSRQYLDHKRKLNKWLILQRRVRKFAANFALDDSQLSELLDIHIESLNKSIKDFDELSKSTPPERMPDIMQIQIISKLPSILIEARIAVGWTQTDLARRTGLRVQHVHRYEKSAYSQIRLNKAIEIASLLAAELNNRRDAMEKISLKDHQHDQNGLCSEGLSDGLVE